MALAASRTFLVLFVTFCTPGCGWTAEKLVRTHNGKTAADRGGRDSWERTIHLDGRPVDRYTIGSSKLARPHRLLKGAKGSSSPPVEEAVDPEWVNLDGFAVTGNSSTGPGRSRQTVFRNQPPVARAARVDRTTYPLRASNARTNRRTPLQSSGPRQAQGASTRTRLLETRRQHNTKPQSDQRNPNTHILTSESVHVVSLQALKTPGQNTLGKTAVTTKTTPESVDYEAQDISVRVMSPQSVLVSWVHPALEMGKVDPQVARSYTVRYREKGESARWEYKESHQRRVLIDTLTADSMYEFSVRISEGTNEGKWSISVFQRTPESAPSGPPENFEVKPLRGKGTAVKATWDPPEEPNGRIKEYILSYAPAMKPFGLKTVTYRGTTTTATIEGLVPGDRYIFKIRATNRRGQGPQSKAISIAMPGSSSIASSFPKSKESHKTSHSPPKQDESDLQSTQEREEPSERRSHVAVPTNRRVRPLSQTRSYHSIFSSLRGSVRGDRGSSRGKAQDREYDDGEEEEGEEEEEEISTTQPPTKETTTEEVKLTTKQPENNVSPESEDEIEYDEDQWTTETPVFKIVTPSPTKKVSRARSPIKIRVHQKPGIKAASSSTSSSSSSKSLSSSFPSTSSSSSSSTPSKNSVSSASNTKESIATEKEYPASTSPESKKTYDKPSTTFTKPSMNGGNDANLQQRDATSVGKGSTGRTSGSGFSPRYSHGQRHSGISSRGNSTRVTNGYKPAIVSQANLPKTSLTSRGSTAQSTLPDRTQTHKTTQAISSSTTKRPSQSVTQSPEKSRSYNFDKTKSKGSTTSQTAGSTLNRLTTVKTSESSQSSSHNANNARTLHKVNEKDTFEEENENSDYKTTDAELAKAVEPTSPSKPQPKENEKKVEKGRESSSRKPGLTPNRVSASFAERFPWIASRYPIRLSPGKGVSPSRPDGRTPTTRTSSSAGAGTPIVRGTTTRMSGATGAVGVSRIQETAEDPSDSLTHDSLKNGIGSESARPSLTNRNTVTSEPRIPSTSSSFSSTSLSTTTSKPITPSYSNGQRDSRERNHSETSNGSNNDHDKEYLKSTGNAEKNNKVSNPVSAVKNPSLTSAEPRKNSEERRTMVTPSRSSSGSTSGVTSTNVRPGVGANRRGHHPLLANRQFSGSRLPNRMQQGENPRQGSSSSQSSSSSIVPQPVHPVGNGNTLTKTGEYEGSNSQATMSSSGLSSSASSSSARDSFRGQGFRNRHPSLRGKLANGGQFRPGNGNGRNGRPNLTATNEKDSSNRGISKAAGQKSITGPDGMKWVVDLEQGVLMNQDGQILQDSQGKPKRVVLGEDGRTIFDLMGSPLVNQEGMALFGHGRDSRPVVNPKEKLLMVGGKPVLGLDLPHLRTTTTTTTTAAPTTTTPEPPTPKWITEESTTPLLFPTCPPGTFSRTDEYGNPVLDPDGILDCYPEDDLFAQTTQQPTTTMATTTTSTTTSTPTEIATTVPDSTSHNNSPSSAYDLSGRKRFTAAYVNYIRKDPGAPCSLTEALEYLQVDILEDLMKNDSLSANQVPPKHKPHNLTVVAMEGCHSFIILDWARPLKDDMVSGYMVYSASYDDVLNNRWSSRLSSGTHLPLENLKPNSRYYFKVQAKNVFGLGPISETLSYVTESDDPLLIERPPGGEPIWVPFKFKYNSAHSSCKGSQYVKRTWYRKFVGVVLCNSLRYKIFMGNGLREPFYSIGDTVGQGEDHCQFVDSYRDGRTGPAYLSHNLPSAHGFYRAYRQEPVTFGVIGRRTRHPFVGWYECGVPVPGKW
ncbi:fibronectin type III domain-containing protein 1 isoform X2 [Takifugu flavidus]|uniref:fibronectin type III domain-containing protein 1 isoform X2 n=1 Tax=Takifugu flavidus TaxID=433684 RepID=UPI0025444B15|nr:fibronectin type III domain-containing protein 1 isoform X2 [Takifugu flavidus]